jgi:succinyl-diaminopimelate desuccinylase
MHAVVEKLQQLKREVEQRTTRFNILSEQVRNSILMLGGESGGTNFNVVPAQCWFTIDRRINPEEDLAAERTKLLDVLERCKQDGIPPDWDIFQECASTFCDEDGPLGKALSQSVHAVTGEAPRFEMCPGLLEIRFYVAQGMPAFAYGGIALRGAWPKQIRRPEKNCRHRRHLCTDSDRNASSIVSALSL